MNQGKANIHPIAQLGSPVLRLKAAEVEIENILDDEVQQLINQMMTTVSEAGGVGIAAPQIHHSLRIFIKAPHPKYSLP